jgi:hypothetical protein
MHGSGLRRVDARDNSPFGVILQHQSGKESQARIRPVLTHDRGINPVASLGHSGRITIKRPSHGWQSTGKPNDRIVGVIPLGAIQAVPAEPQCLPMYCQVFLTGPHTPFVVTQTFPRCSKQLGGLDSSYKGYLQGAPFDFHGDGENELCVILPSKQRE